MTKINKDTEKGVAIGIAIGAVSALLLSSRKVHRLARHSARRVAVKAEPAADRVKRAAGTAREEAAKKKAGTTKRAPAGTQAKLAVNPRTVRPRSPENKK